MTPKKILKVCKIDSIAFASFALKQKADFFGVHVIYKNDIGKRFQLVQDIKAQNGKVIIVTYINDLVTLQELIALYQPAGVQFHYPFNPELVRKIKQMNPGLLLFGVLSDEESSPNFAQMDQLLDWIIYDTNYRGGTGEASTYQHLKNIPPSLLSKTLLAGGINPKRVRELANVGTAGFDVQSLFRSGNLLNFRSLENLVDVLKFPRTRSFSVSLTDIPLTQMKNIGRYFVDPNLDYHLDYSDTTLYPKFDTTKYGIEEKERFLSQLPHSIHFFLNSNEKLREHIADFYKKYSLSLTRVFLQYFPEIDCNLFTSQRKHDCEDKFNDSVLKVIPSVFYKDLDLFFERFIECDFISIVVPPPEKKQNIESFIEAYKRHENKFKGKEVWLDRNLNIEFVKMFQERLGRDFNYIIGKEVIADWTKLPAIHEQISKT